MSGFTDLLIKNLKPRDRRYEVREGRGFGMWVYPSGQKSWVYTYTLAGRKERYVLGEYPDMSLSAARAEYANAKALVREGVSPREKDLESKAEERSAPTVSKLVNEYMERWAKPRKKSWAEDDRMLQKDVKSIWGKRKAKDIKRRDVRLLLDSIVERGAPIQANRVLAVLRRMFNWAVEQDILEASPCAGVKAPGQERTKDRVLSLDEIRTLWRALDVQPTCEEQKEQADRETQSEDEEPIDMGEAVRNALRLILVTAQRPGEVAALPLAEIEDTWWTIPAERAKNGQAHRVPLTALALSLIPAEGEYVFPSPLKKRGGITEHALAHALRRNMKRLGVEPFTPHDLRRTAASHMTGMGIPRLVVQKILNHVESGVTAVYDRHGYDAEKRQALEAWSRKLGEIIAEEQGSNVVPFVRKNGA